MGHAREAVALDIRDGRSWYTLGNAFLTQYFATGAWDFGQLRQALKAYQNAVSVGRWSKLLRHNGLPQMTNPSFFLEPTSALCSTRFERDE